MKILKINEGKGFYSINGVDWKQIDEIDKDGLMYLLNIVLKETIAEMDEYNEKLIGNQAHQIIYQSIFEKLTTLKSQKNQFKDESDRLYMEAISKYSLKSI